MLQVQVFFQPLLSYWISELKWTSQRMCRYGRTVLMIHCLRTDPYYSSEELHGCLQLVITMNYSFTVCVCAFQFSLNAHWKKSTVQELLNSQTCLRSTWFSVNVNIIVTNRQESHCSHSIKKLWTSEQTFCSVCYIIVPQDLQLGLKQ